MGLEVAILWQDTLFLSVTTQLFVSMKLVKSLFLIPLIMSQLAVGQTQSTQATITIQLDFESAKAIIELLGKSKASDTELIQIAKLYGSQQLIRKVSNYDKSGTEATFKQTLQEVVETGTVKGHDPFDWKLVKSNSVAIRQLIQQLETKQTFVDDVKALILPYTPANIMTTIRACFLVGGGSLGFTVGNDNTFNVALQKIGDDYEGLMYLVAHELYHSIQSVGEHSRVKQKTANDPPKPIVNAYTLLANLWAEGSATLVGDFTNVKAPKAFTKIAQEEYTRNGDRTRQNFALFESLLFSAFYDSTANMGELYNIGFTTAYDETSYYAGYRMAKVIEKYKGRQALADCVNKDALEFCQLYVSIYKAHPNDPIIRFSASTEAIITKVEPWKNKL